jgi:hypothetical protein
VLLVERVTVTCDMKENGVVLWLTRETGMIPEECAEFRCWAECECEGNCSDMAMEDRGESLCRSYVAVVVAYPGSRWGRKQVFLAALSAASVNVVWDALTVKVRPSSGLGQCLAGCLQRGILQASFAGGAECICGVGGVTHTSRVCSAVCDMFVVQNRFEGTFPLGEEHWWGGVTAALDGVLGPYCGWLVCAH